MTSSIAFRIFNKFAVFPQHINLPRVKLGCAKKISNLQGPGYNPGAEQHVLQQTAPSRNNYLAMLLRRLSSRAVCL